MRCFTVINDVIAPGLILTRQIKAGRPSYQVAIGPFGAQRRRGWGETLAVHPRLSAGRPDGAALQHARPILRPGQRPALIPDDDDDWALVHLIGDSGRKGGVWLNVAPPAAPIVQGYQRACDREIAHREALYVAPPGTTLSIALRTRDGCERIDLLWANKQLTLV